MTDRRLATMRERARAVSQRLRHHRRQWYGTPALLTVTFLLLGALPLALDVPVLGLRLGSLLSVHLLVVALVWATAAQSWNIVSGFAGQFSFGHAAFFGLGAYVPLVLVREFALNPWLGMLVGGALAAVYACVIGVLSFRYDVSGSYFALATLAFAELLLYVFVNTEALGGANGYVRPLPGEYGSDFGLLAFQFTGRLPYYYVILAFLALVTLVAVVIRRSRVGLYLFAIRDDEDAASAVGIPTTRYKLFAFAVSAFFTAWAGAFWSMYFTSIRPRVVFGLLVNIDILLPAAVGGIGTVLGPIVGSLGLTTVSELARQAVELPSLQDVVYGLLLLAVVLGSPGGVVTWPGRIADWLDRDQEE